MTLDTFPKYLLANAERIGARPAMRHKDYGIWQTWSWAEQLREVRTFALGLRDLGLEHGERVAIVGANRPRLYWAMAAVQSLGGIPVPVYADAVAEELAYVLNNSGVRFAVVQDQEQVDKVQSFAKDIPQLTHLIFDEPRGLRDYARNGLHDFADIQKKGAALLAADPSLGERWTQAIRAASGDDISVMLYTSGTTGRSKGVMIKASHAVNAARDTACLRQSQRDRLDAGLSAARVGR
jgi:long-chain acyl-CoA synthetase